MRHSRYQNLVIQMSYSPVETRHGSIVIYNRTQLQYFSVIIIDYNTAEKMQLNHLELKLTNGQQLSCAMDNIGLGIV